MSTPRDGPRRTGVLLAQLGTPDAPTTPALRRYLAEFLADPRVVDLPRWIWRPILHGIILRTRPRRSAARYRNIWTAAGSPLLLHSRAQARGLEERLAGSLEARPPVAVGMRYGSPSLSAALDDLVEQGCGRILVAPLYPQHCVATTASAMDAIGNALRSRMFVPALRVLSPFCEDPGYVGALAARVRESVAAMEAPPERYLLSFHGEPESYRRRGDPYAEECARTARALAATLELPQERWQTVFQSRFGPAPWLRPYLDDTLASLAAEGVRRVVVAMPGFVADCLETLDEVGREARLEFVAAGGEDLVAVPCLNDHPAWLDALHDLVRRDLAGWA